MPKLSWMTLARGARQLVVQEALDTTVISLVYLSWLTPITNMGASELGAEMTTFLAPPLKWALAFSTVVLMPVDSMIYSAPHSLQGISPGVHLGIDGDGLPLTTSLPSLASAVPSKRPCTYHT